MTGIMPFFTNKGYHLNITVHPECDLVSTHTHDFVTDLDELHQELRKNIVDTQHRSQVPTDSRHTEAPKFPVGSQAFIKAQFFQTT